MDTRTRLYGQAGHWLGDYDATGAPLQQAIWLDDLPVGLLANGNQLHYVQPDHLGTPRVVIEVARDVPVWTWDAKGEAFGATAPNQDPDGDAHAFVFDMRFPGQRYDAASGLNYNYFRDYDTGSGRYVQSDPIGLLGGISTYGYVGGNPISYIDPLGLQTVGPGVYVGGMPRPTDSCLNAAMADSILNLTPGVGTIKAFTEGPNSLDAGSGVMSTTSAVTEIGTRRADAASNARLQDLESWDRNRREQAALRTSIQANKGLNQFLRAIGRSLGILSVGVEAVKFSEAAEKCWCKANGK